MKVKCLKKNYPIRFDLHDLRSLPFGIALRLQRLHLLGNHSRDSLHIFLVHPQFAEFVLIYEKKTSSDTPETLSGLFGNNTNK